MTILAHYPPSETGYDVVHQALRKIGVSMVDCEVESYFFGQQVVACGLREKQLVGAFSFRKGTGGEVSREICRYLANAKRVELWQSAYGPMPEGQRVGWTCTVAYCGNLEHMTLTENLNHGRNNWKDLAQKLATLPLDGFFDVPGVANDEQSRLNMRCALTMRRECTLIQFAIRSLTKSSGGVRIIKVGGYCGEGELISRTQSLSKHPLIVCTSTVRPWQRPTPAWWGQFFNPMNPSEYKKPPLCKIAGCVFPTLRGSGDYCYQHNHWFDFPISMTDNKVDRQNMFRASEPHAGYELAAERLLSIAALERSLRVERNGYVRIDHKNAGAEEVKTRSSLPNYSRSPSRLRMRSAGGAHSSSKTTRGRARAASRQGKGGRHSTKEKRWTRQTIASLEKQANKILGEVPVEYEYNFIPEEERMDQRDAYERGPAITELQKDKSDFEKLFGA